MAKQEKTPTKKKPVQVEITDKISDAEIVEDTAIDEIEAREPENAHEDDMSGDTDISEEVSLPEHAEGHEEEHHFSLAARSLQILGLLVAGAVLGIWAAPRIAPVLPAGMAPIAQWLSPSNNAAIEDVEQLRTQIEARLTELETLPSRQEIETRLANFQTDTVNPVRSQMTALSDQVAAADSTAVESRLWALEGRVEGLIAEIDGMTSALGNIAAEGGAISADMAASISAYRTRIDGLQASLNEMSSLQGALSQRIDEVAATAERQVVEAENLVAEATEQNAATLTNAEILSSISEIESALKTGTNFKTPLERLAANTEQSIPAALAAAQNGVLTLEELQADFVPAAHNAIRASISTNQTGVLASFGAFVKSQVATRSLTPQEGDGADAVLSRMEAALLRDDLDGVLAEFENLPDTAKTEMAGWLETLNTRLSVKTGLASLRRNLGLEE